MRCWVDKRRLNAGLKLVPCAGIASTFLETLLCSEPDISLEDFARRLAREEKLWCRRNLKEWLATKRVAMKKTLVARESIRAHGAVATGKQSSAESVMAYPVRVPVTSPAKLI